MKALDEADPGTNSFAVQELLRAVQVYVGQLDVPFEDTDALAKKRKEILAWWTAHCSQSPAQWVASVLSRRGVIVEFDRPDKVLSWAKEMLMEGSMSERYVATLILIYAFPDDPGILFPDTSFILEQETTASPLADYLLQSRLAQTAYWTILSHALEWDTHEGEYVIGPTSAQTSSPNANE